MNAQITCPNCSQEMTVEEAGLATCPSCQQVCDVPASVFKPRRPPPTPVETTPVSNGALYRDSEILVTPTELRLGGTTYAVRNISSVTSATKDPSRLPEILFGFVGLACLGAASYVGAIVFAGATVAAFALRKPDYIISLDTNAGTREGARFKDRERAGKVLGAIEKAITGA